jgi:hypothetical protein
LIPKFSVLPLFYNAFSDFGKRLGRAPLQFLHRDQVVIESLARGGLRVGHDPGDDAVFAPDDQLPKRIGRGHAVARDEIVVRGVVAPDDAAQNE